MDSGAHGLVIAFGLLCVLLRSEAAVSAPTHNCSLSILGQKVDLSCRQTDIPAAAKCSLVVYYNSATPHVGQRSAVTFGVQAKPLPSQGVNDWTRAEQYPITGLNLTEPTYNVTFRPLLLFYGSKSCNVRFTAVNIQGVDLSEKNSSRCPCDRSMVLAFGGGLNATISSGEVEANVATHVVAVLANSSLAMNDTSVVSNNASGAVFASWNSSGLNLSHCTFSGNHGASDRAAVSAIKANVTISSCKFVSNKAGNEGAALHVRFSNVTVRASNFTANSAPKGGAIAVYDKCRVLIDECHFINNTARSAAVSSDLDSDFFKLGVGGALFAESSAVNITHSTFFGNKALINGGAIHVQLTHLQHKNPWAERLEMRHSTLENNLAYRHGAALYVGAREANPNKSISDPYAVLIFNSTFRLNVARANGGAIMLQAGATLNITNSSITNNSAWISGGGIATEMGSSREDYNDSRTNLILRHVTFKDNSGSGQDLFAGPNFKVNFTDTCNINELNHTVTWFKRNCTWGEYKVASGFCELCPPFTWQPTNGSNFIGGVATAIAAQQNPFKCEQKPPFTYAPGGSVLVPLPFYWHGMRLTTQHPDVGWCSDCQQEGIFRLRHVVRCPNPAACRHNETELSYRHPGNASVRYAKRMRWHEYGQRLCTADKGYTGVMCGVCKPGYGAVAPFTCHECVQGQDTSPRGRTKISMLYILYWFVLTVWFLFTSWGAVLSKASQKSAKGGAHKLPGSTPAEDGSTVVLINGLPQEHEEGGLGKAGSRDHNGNAPSSSSAASAGVAAGAGSPSRSKHLATTTCSPRVKLRLPDKYKEANLMDVTKAIMIYAQWVILILSLPIIWLPEELAYEQAANINRSSSEHAQRIGQKLLGVILGRLASLDCLMDAWGKWTASTAHDISSAVLFKAAANLIIIPLILFLSVAATQFLWWHTRGWLVRLVIRWRPRRSRAAFGKSDIRWTPDPGSRLQPAGSKKQSPALQEICTGGELKSTDGATSKLPSTQSVTGGWKGKSLGTYMFEHIVAALLVLIFYYYYSFARTALGLLFCVKVGDSRRWVMDVRLQCPLNSGATPHRVGALLLGIPALMFCVLWPIGIAIVLLHAAHKGKLYGAQVVGVKSVKDRLRAMLAFRYADYDIDYAAFTADRADNEQGLRGVSLSKLQHVLVRNMVLAWDSVLDLIRFMLALISLCVALHEIHQLALVLLVLSIYMLLVLVVRPWRSPAVQLFQVLGLLVLLLSCLGIMACAVREADTNYGTAQLYRPVLSWSVVVLNILYMASAVVILGWCVVKQVRQAAPTLFRLLRHVRAIA